MTHYETLGVNSNATQDEIKKAYRKLSLKYHPDKSGDSKKFQEINEAYQVVGDVNERKKYDMSQSGGGMFGGRGIPFQNNIPEEILRRMFGGNMAGGGGGMPFFSFTGDMNGMSNVRIFRNGVEQNMNSPMKKPVPIIKTIQITLEQSYNGVKIPFELDRWVLENNIKKVEKETIYVDIPKGIDNNEIIFIRGKGNIISDTNKGDIKLFIKVTNDTEFKREGLNLILNKDITLKESLCGFDFMIKYFNNRKFTIKNEDNVIAPGFSKVIPELGLKRDNHTGNLIIKFNVIFPEKINPENIQKLKELL